MNRRERESVKDSQKSASLYSARVFKWAGLVLSLLLTVNWASAQPDFAAPRPAPTDAVKASGQTFTSKGRAPVTQGRDKARYAALMDAFRNLAVDGLERGLLGGGWGELEGSHWLYRIDQDHPNDNVLSWLTRSKVIKEKTSKGDRVLTVQSPARGELSAIKPEFRAVESMDVDGNGLTDTISVGYDGAIYILTPGDDEWKILSRSPSYGSFEVVSGPGLERVRSVLPLAIDSVDVTAQGWVRVLLRLETAEVVNGQLLGTLEEKREVLVSLSGSEDDIRFSVDEPLDFTKVLDTEAELRGRTISERPLESLQISHNGELSWESPEGLKTTGLRFNLARPLVAGWNLFRITARDEQGFLKRRDLWLHGPEGAAPAAEVEKRAVIATLDSNWREKKVLGELMAAGFRKDMITVLDPTQPSGTALLDAIRDSKGGQDLLLYCEAKSVLGDLVGGKTLDYRDLEVGPTELAQAFNAGEYRRVTALFHTEEKRMTGRSDQNVWRDTARFLDRLGDGGRLVFANLEDDELNIRTRRRHSRERFRAALRADSGGDLERLFDPDEPNTTLFRGWTFGRPILGSRS